MRYDAFVHRGFQEGGVTSVVVARTDDAGWLQGSVFLIDLWCLGVKNAIFVDMPALNWPRQLDRFIPPGERIAIHPACARKLVEGSVAYAESLGFMPHRDFKAARRAFGSMKAAECPETFAYGRDGKPLFIAGPNDDDERIERILRTLHTKLGPDGFNYVLPVESHAANISAAESLRDLLSDHPLGVTSFEALSGFLTALQICPTEIPVGEFMAEIWDDEPEPFAGVRDALTAEKLVHSYREELATKIAAARDAADPARVVDFEVDADCNDIGSASEWCQGFLRPLALWPEAWRGAAERAGLKPHFEFIRAVADGGKPDAGDIPVSTAEVPTAVGHTVLALHAALRPLPAGHRHG